MTGSFKIQLVNMGTRGAAFQAKLRGLHEYHVRLLSNQVPPPSGSDIANSIKYFSQTLLTVLKDVPCSPLEMIKDPSLDQARMSSYPNLEYQNLYNALTMLLDVASSIQSGLTTFGKALLQCFGCILPFLDRDLIDNLPYLAASSISVLPPSLHQDIINYLCYYILPFTITRQSNDDQECHACQSVSAVIMLVFQYSDNPAHHCQLLECLMRLKHNVVKDLLCVIAYGTSASRASAAKLLFYYWPAFDPNLFDRKGLLSKFTNNLVPFVCQREACPNAGNAEAVKVCYNHRISILYAVDSPPPLYLCIECANEIHRDHPDLSFGDILHPMQQVSMICENKNCRSMDKSAISMCFSSECASYNGNHPIRYCAQCHGNRHNSRRGIDHIVHRILPPMMMMDAEMQTYMIEAVISLLREAKPLSLEYGRDSSSDARNNAQDILCLENRQLLGRYGIWLLVGRCKPTTDTPVEVLGRLLSMLFHWFHVTAYSYDGRVESTLEKLKLDHICGWLKDVCSSHYKEFIDCLLPHPPEHSRVGGHWDTLASRTSHLKEGLQRLICLIPYEVITQQIWDTVMPHWLEAITNDVPEKELPELKIVLSKMLDPEMSPLGFDAKSMYNFVSIRFEKTTAKVQQQALHWLQNLTKLEILIPLSQLFAMFVDGVRIMKYGIQADYKDKEDKIGGNKTTKDRDITQPRRSSISPVVEDDSGNTSAISDDEAPISRHTEFASDAEHNLTCCILMLDILLKQMTLQEIEQHSGIYTSVSECVYRLLKCMVTAAKVGLGSHTCTSKECGYCEASVMWHQLSTKLVQYLAPQEPVRPPDSPLKEIIEDEKPPRKSPPESEKESKNRERDVSLSMAPLPIPLGPLGPVPVAVPQPEPHSVGGVLVHMPHVCSIMTATVETVSEQLDLAAIIPSEKVVTAVARSVTLSDADVATATVQIAQPTVVSDNNDETHGSVENDLHYNVGESGDFWHTSVGKFKFVIESLPQSLQYIYQLLKEIPIIEQPDILYYTLQCLKVMTLHGDAFAKAARDDRGFFIWCQENLLIKNFWEICNAKHSHICEVAVPILLHCITLPLGSDVFWKVVHDGFNDSDWRIRFQAVERVTVLTRFMDSTPLRSEINLQISLATAFCHLIAACDDVNVHVAQRATLYLGTIHDKAIRALLYCLESQFDMFIVDRPVVLQSVYQLHNMLSDRKVLTWDFFLNRFDTLFVEAQLALEKTGDISHLRDLRNSENGSEILSNKIIKAREAISQSDISSNMSKTLSASFGTKWPYKRTMSDPATIISRQESKTEKEKIYNRQTSVPILKRKSSRFGLDGHIHLIGGQGEDSNVPGSLNRVIDLEEGDKETIHLLIFLLMQFMSRADLAYPTDEKPTAKQQLIVLRHLYLLLGYNQTEKNFHISPTRLRTSPVFNSFMANLPQVLDQNYMMGCLLLPTIMQVMLYAPYQGNAVLQSGTDSIPNIAHNFSLWYMENHVRRCWMMSVLVILYKYQYNQPPHTDQMQNMVRLVINSLDSHFHQCRRIPATVLMDMPTARSRDYSQQSLTAEQDDKFHETPPPSPIFSSEGPSHGHHHSSKQKSSKLNTLGFRKYPDSSLETDDTESELVAIPESDLSDSTLQGSSAPGSFDDTIYFEDICAPMKNELTRKKASQHVTTANLTTAQVVISTISTGEKDENLELSKTLQKIISSGGGDNVTIDQNDRVAIMNKVASTQKCSVQEGVRMMVTSSMLGQPKVQAILNPPANVQKAIVVTQNILGPISKSKDVTDLKATYCSVQQPTKSPVNDSSNILSCKQENAIQNSLSSWTEERSTSPTKKALGRQKRIIEPCLTPASTPISNNGTPQYIADEASKNSYRNHVKHFEGPHNFASPETPLSKMNLMISPSEKTGEGSLSPKNIAQLEIPTLERLLPIGQYGTDGISALVDKVREVLTIPAINHLKHDNLDKSEGHWSNKNDVIFSNQGTSPRKLIKQVALESPSQIDDQNTQNMLADNKIETTSNDKTVKYPRQRIRKVGPFSMGSISNTDIKMRYAGNWIPSNKDDSDKEDINAANNVNSEKPSASRIGDECVCERCSECGAIKEEYTDEEMGIMLVLLGTFIHREPTLAAPFLPEILTIVSRVALHSTYPWQCESTTHLPGGSMSVAHQFIRCVLHQLSPNGVFYQIFLTQANEIVRRNFFKSIVISLNDFTDLSPVSPVQLLAETLNSKKTLPVDMVSIILRNLSEYLQCVPIDNISGNTWSIAVQGIDNLIRRVMFFLQSLDGTEHLLHIMISMLKVPQLSKSVLEPFSKLLSYAIQNIRLTHKVIVDLCYLNNRAFIKERDKMHLCRQMVFELVQALKFKTSIPDNNLLLLIGILLHDAGSAMPPGIVDDLPETAPSFNCNIAECMRQTYLNDVIEFLADFHTLSKIKNIQNGAITTGFSEDTLGGVLKGAVAQYLALELSRGNSKDSRTVSRYLPWLNNAPSSLQQGPKEFTECVGHMRLLSWLLLGSLTHYALMNKRIGNIGQHGATVHYYLQHPVNTVTQPVPQESSCHIADHIQVIFAGFAEQSKTSVLHMSSLFHAFTLCQLWTLYLEQIAFAATSSTESHNVTMAVLFEFWAKVTPCILQLVSHSKISESVNLHFLSLLEALKETRSTMLAKLLPLWTPVLTSNTQLSGTLHVRLQNCRDAVPNASDEESHSSETLLKWLQRLQFKMGQIELQSSTATQFYTI